MTLFDLLFLLAVLASMVTLFTVLLFAVRGADAWALKVLGVYAVCVVVYLLAGVAVSYFTPQRFVSSNDPWCFDDWCLQVQNVTHSTGPADNSYRIDFRIFSRASRVAQRAKGAWIYLIDDKGRRFSPAPDSSAVPLDVLLQPDESVTTSRLFHVPGDAQRLGLITGHGGAYCGAMSFLIIGEGGCWFGKPTMIRLQ